MRYEKGHKEITRQRIVETAATRFRKDGIESVGVADLMAEAGLTVGGFYSHFDSKEDLVRAAMEEAASRSEAKFERRINEGGLENWIRMYLSSGHRDHPEEGCTVAALATELSRHPQSTRTGFTETLSKLLKAIASHLPAPMSPAQKTKTALGLFAAMVGSVQMARAVTDPRLSEQILEAGISTALSLAQIKTVSSR